MCVCVLSGRQGETKLVQVDGKAEVYQVLIVVLCLSYSFNLSELCSVNVCVCRVCMCVILIVLFCVVE